MEWFVRIYVALFVACLVWRGTSQQCPDQAGQRCVRVDQSSVIDLYPGLNIPLNFTFSSELLPNRSRIALFNSASEFGFCNASGSSYDLGSGCRYLSVVNNTQGRWTVVVECRNPINASTGQINLIFRMADRNATRVARDLTCDSVLNVSWTQTCKFTITIHVVLTI